MVLILDKHKKPLNPVKNADARILLSTKNAIVHKHFPVFTIMLKKEIIELPKSFQEKFHDKKEYIIKIDPGELTTGISITYKNILLFFFEITHRGREVKRLVKKRSGVRKSRRNRKTRYRKPRFNNRTRKTGWLPPSVKSRADNIINFVKKIIKFLNISEVYFEEVSFDTSSMTNGKQLYGKEYQEGNLKDTNIRRFLMVKHNKSCVYCGSYKKKLESEHILCKSKGGTNSLNNLTLSCKDCNDLKDNLSLKDFGKLIGKDLSFLEPKSTPKSAAIVQSAKKYTAKEIGKIVPIKLFPSYQTYTNRKELGLPKEHYYDAMVIGELKNYIIIADKVVLINACGRGSRQMTRVDGNGFPRQTAKANKIVKGFMTGDMVSAMVTKGKKIGKYFGKVAIRSSGNFNIVTNNGKVTVIKYLQISIKL